uniref:TGB3 n=1 Tax=Garlic virus X TaxID=150284 RepID=A0A6M2YXZ4_9VIRU|nr:TGB3 [Garlic virus X]QED44970.1 TGB3 [Garlic virus X]QED44976.1 TGB3 [Garlic virus X]
MTHATAWQLYETQNYIVDHINTIINQIARRVSNASGTDAHQQQFLDYKIKEIVPALDAITTSILARTQYNAQNIQNRRSSDQSTELRVSTIDRTFFTNLSAALDTTSNLINHVPPTRYALPTASLPLDELYGLLHALHRNSLEWLTHISHDTEQIANKLNNVETILLSEVRTNSQKIDIVLEKLANLESHLSKKAESDFERDLAKSMASIETQVQELHARFREMNHEGSSTLGGNPSTSSIPESSGLNSLLPTFTPEHPTARCRAYGSVEFGGAVLQIPMDVRGRRASTALRLSVKHTPKREATTVKYKLFDDGALLFTEELSTPHKFLQPFSDSLALLHAKCPNFLYKIRDEVLC